MYRIQTYISHYRKAELKIIKLDCVDWPKFEKLRFIQEIMKGIEELEWTTVIRWSWNLLGTLWHVLWTITPAYHIERSVFELSRTKDMGSIQLLTRPLNQIEQTKTIGIEEKRMLFERVQLDWVIERSGTLYKKHTNGTKSFNWSSVETAKAIWSFGSFHYCISIFWEKLW